MLKSHDWKTVLAFQQVHRDIHRISGDKERNFSKIFATNIKKIIQGSNREQCAFFIETTMPLYYRYSKQRPLGNDSIFMYVHSVQKNF
jgi:hypothetical protein